MKNDLKKKSAQQHDAPLGGVMKTVCFLCGFPLIGTFIYIYQYRKGRKRRAEEAMEWSVYGGLLVRRLFNSEATMISKEKLNHEVLNNRDQIPEILHRAFSEVKHAQDFVEQELLRMGSPEYYGQIEDKNRRDTKEGKGLIIIPELVDVVSIN